MANVYLTVDETGFTVASDNVNIYGQQGNENIIVQAGTTGNVVDQNVEQVVLDGEVSDFTFKQSGNRLLVFGQDDMPMVTIALQNDENGTELVFDDGTYSALFGEGNIIELGGTVVPNNENAHVIPEDDQPQDQFTSVNVDTKTFPEVAVFDAGSDTYLFTDNATKASNVVIDNFSANDRISFTHADVNDYAFSNDGTDVMLSYNYNDTGTMNLIQLTGVVDVNDLVYDLSSFTTAAGFNPFTA